MNCPTKEQILDAAKSSINVRKALEKLFPEAFEKPIYKGELYEWGTDSDGGSGLVITHPESTISETLTFINFRTGDIYLSRIPKSYTRKDLAEMMLEEQLRFGRKKFHNCFDGELKGPKHFRSWCTK